VRVQPRQQLLEIWQAVTAHSYRDGAWHWGGRDGRNSISDAEQLLCVIGPATAISPFSLDDPDRTNRDVAAAMKPLGDEREIPVNLLRAVGEYLRTYSDDAGTPIFTSESYFQPGEGGHGRELTELQRAQPVVDSFAISLSLSLATIGFVRQYKQSRKNQRRTVPVEIEETEALASRRLTAAMAGLLRSPHRQPGRPARPAGRVDAARAAARDPGQPA
jgi:hypothetical protein